MSAAPVRMTRAQADEIAARALALLSVRAGWTPDERQLWADFSRIRCLARGCTRTAAFVYVWTRRDAWQNETAFSYRRVPRPADRESRPLSP